MRVGLLQAAFKGRKRRKEALFQVIVKNGIVISTKIEAFSQNEAPKRLRLDCACVLDGAARRRDTCAVWCARPRGPRCRVERFC